MLLILAYLQIICSIVCFTMHSLESIFTEVDTSIHSVDSVWVNADANVLLEDSDGDEQDGVGGRICNGDGGSVGFT